MRPVCYCNEEKAQCETCGKGYAQELAAGRTPKFIPKVEPKPIQSRDIFEDEEEMLERKAKVQDWMNKNFDFMCKGNNTPSGSQSTPSITDYLLKKSSEDSILSRDGTSEAVPASQPRNFTPEKQK